MEKAMTPHGTTTSPVQAAGSTPANESDGVPVPNTNNVAAGNILLADHESNQTIDFGFVPLCDGKLGDYVWIDADGDGIQDMGEQGINGLTMTLSGLNSHGQAVSQTATTGPNPNGGH